MADALHPDPETAAVIDAVHRSGRSHAWVARRIGISDGTMHRKMTCKSQITVVEAMRMMRAVGTTFAVELRRAGV
ncbi:hypothetical protein C5C94_16280 [Rathayibacter sp. AY1C3]|uniref:hypothetical protein n=1 Tax=Rathayibacter sp. AY1C3 TaxID=2080536 RepID=UPI000CE859E9|nr:hypothetical protein [Rathayibacter sp. AY1C3]PPH26843.1 hypothetical protein C5C94_16280 [Rathayibacter sp. AY1C3]